MNELTYENIELLSNMFGIKTTNFQSDGIIATFTLYKNDTEYDYVLNVRSHVKAIVEPDMINSISDFTRQLFHLFYL